MPRALKRFPIVALLSLTFIIDLYGCEATEIGQSRNQSLEGIWYSDYRVLILTPDSMIWEEKEGKLISTGRYETNNGSIILFYRPRLELGLEGRTVSGRYTLDHDNLHLITADDTTSLTRSAISPEELLGSAMPCANQTGAWYAAGVDLYPSYPSRGKQVLELYVPIHNVFTGSRGNKRIGDHAIRASVSTAGNRIRGLSSTGLYVECREGTFQPELTEDGGPRSRNATPIVGGWNHITYKGDRYQPIQMDHTNWVLFGIIDIPHSTSSTPTSEAVIEAFEDVRTAYRRRIDLVRSLLVVGRNNGETESSDLHDLEVALDRATQNEQRVASVLESESVQRYIDVQEHLGAALSAFLVETHESPDLRSGAAFQDLMAQLEGTENRVNVARRDYNAAVSRHNETVRNTGQGRILSPFSAGSRAELAPEVSFD